MEELVENGLTKSIGVSNFNKQQIQHILDVATIKPVNNQVKTYISSIIFKARVKYTFLLFLG